MICIHLHINVADSLLLYIKFQKQSFDHYVTSFEKELLQESSQNSKAPQVIKIGDVPYFSFMTHREEEHLVQYLRHYKSLTKKDICHLTCVFSISRQIKVPDAWKANNLDAMGWVNRFIVRHELLSLLTDNSEKSMQKRKSFPEVEKKQGMAIHPGWYVCNDGKVRSSETIKQFIRLDHSYASNQVKSTVRKQVKVRDQLYYIDFY